MAAHTPRERTHEQRDNKMHPERQGDAEAHPPREGRGREHLPLAADVEEARPERHPNTEPGKDERGCKPERACERLNRPEEILGAVVQEGPPEHGGKGAADRIAERGERVARTRKEVAHAVEYGLVGEADEECSHDHRDEHRQDRHEGAAACNPVQCLPPAIRLFGLRLRARRLSARRLHARRDGAHAALAIGSPAIMRPSSSRDVVPGTSPMTAPR